MQAGRMSGTIMSPAAAAKARPRKTVHNVGQDDDDDDGNWVPQRPRSSKKRLGMASAVISGGKATKTGMVLARAQLTTSPSGVVAAQERQAALLGKGKYRKAEDLAREAPTGSLSTSRMPKHKGKQGSEVQFKKAFGTWMRTTLKAKVRRARSCAPSCVLMLCVLFVTG